MVSLASLWLPILLSGVAVFFLSFLMWMVVGHHKSDYQKLPDETAVVAALKAAKVPAGHFVFPHCTDAKQMKDPEFHQRFAEMSGFVFVRPHGDYPMGRAMVQTVLFCLVCALAIGYVAHVAFRPGADRMEVFRLTATVGWLTFSFAYVWKAIWGGISRGETIKALIDGLVYALATGAIFAWRWPAA